MQGFRGTGHADYASAHGWWKLVIAAIGIITSYCLAKGDLLEAPTGISGVRPWNALIESNCTQLDVEVLLRGITAETCRIPCGS